MTLCFIELLSQVPSSTLASFKPGSLLLPKHQPTVKEGAKPTVISAKGSLKREHSSTSIEERSVKREGDGPGHLVKREGDGQGHPVKREVVRHDQHVKHDPAAVKHELGGVKYEPGGVKYEVGGTKKEVSGVKQSPGGLKQEVGGVKHEVSGVKYEVSEVKQSASVVKHEVKHEVGHDQPDGIQQSFRKDKPLIKACIYI